jgi:hypothetical protein
MTNFVFGTSVKGSSHLLHLEGLGFNLVQKLLYLKQLSEGIIKKVYNEKATQITNYKHLIIVERLLAGGVAPDSHNEDGLTPLHQVGNFCGKFV